MSSFDKDGRVPTDKGMILTAVGKKRSGKSKLAMRLFRTYPGDRVVLDIAGDDGPERPHDPQFHTLTGTVAEGLPGEWPEHLRAYDQHGKALPMTLRYAPDAGSPTHVEDMDHVVGLAYDHGHCCLLVHEVGVLARANRTPANTRRVLMHNRHRQLTVIFCGPRPADIDPLVIAQSDVIYCFELPNRADRERIADQVGWDRDDFHAAMMGNVEGEAGRQGGLGPHEYLLHDANVLPPGPGEEDRRLVHWPALPEEEIRRIDAWAFPPARGPLERIGATAGDASAGHRKFR
jgi:hypothetical protein